MKKELEEKLVKTLFSVDATLNRLAWPPSVMEIATLDKAAIAALKESQNELLAENERLKHGLGQWRNGTMISMRQSQLEDLYASQKDHIRRLEEENTELKKKNVGLCQNCRHLRLYTLMSEIGASLNV